MSRRPRQAEVHNPLFGPITVVVAVARSHEPAVSAMTARENRDTRIGHDSPIVKELRRYERVVVGRDHQRRNPDLVNDAHRAGAVVVVLGILESEMGSGVRFVELPYRANAAEPPQIETARPGPFL